MASRVWESYVQGLAGPSFVFRARKLLSLQLGIGKLVDKGPAYFNVFDEEIPIMLIFSIGIYIKTYTKNK